jgi:NAD(P)-dependent dehydrogenase (short-subunit alcohol dehydrogenase family)
MRVHDPDRRNLLEGKVALVTGGGGSLALATARLFLKEGARVVLADRDASSLSAALARLDDVQASSVVCDATREDDVAGAVDTVVQRHGRLDVLVADAGAPAVASSIDDCDVADLDSAFAVSVRGALLACKHALRVMSDGGSVVIVSGVAGLRADAGDVVAAAVQHAQVGLMRSVATGVAGRGIRVNTIHAGPADAQSPLGRRAEPAGPPRGDGRDRQVGALPGLVDEQPHHRRHAGRRRRAERLTGAAVSPARCPVAGSSPRAGRPRRW